MGKRGRAPMPTKLRLLTGDPNKSRYNEDEPEPMPGKLDVPSDVADDVARVWRRAVAELESMGLAYPSDHDSWRAFCEAVVMHEKACNVLAKSPILIKGIHGNMVRNPALQVQRESARTLLIFAREFGLTPSARSTIEVNRAGREDDNPFSGTG